MPAQQSVPMVLNAIFRFYFNFNFCSKLNLLFRVAALTSGWIFCRLLPTSWVYQMQPIECSQ